MVSSNGRTDSSPARGFASRAVHAGERAPKPDFTPTATPIYPTSSFFYDETETLDAVFGNEREGYVYTRYGNPTTRALETAVASLEGTDDAVAYASGMAAIHAAILHEVQAGSRVVAARDVYGATYAMLTKLFAQLGVKTTFVDILDLDALATTIREVKPALVAFETISNPLLRVPDIAAISRLAHAEGARLMVDNTFASPYLVNPIRHGADVVVHSTTKYLGGHGDVVGGVIATTRERAAALREQAKLTGPTLGPFEAWLTLRGIKTLPLRVRRQSESAARVAAWLADHPAVAKVNYPGRSDLGAAASVFNDDLRGGMVSFEVAGAGQAEIFRFFQALRLCVPATSLGDVYTLVLHPAMSSHRALTPEQRAEVGIGEGLVRLSIGIEDVEDITSDVDQALRAVNPHLSAAASASSADRHDDVNAFKS
ncbi:MAG: aminotransferase class I/II-fold pyridoxal phosphate-dependent enzyme [Chloroflexota bacterium]|nr:aminotransferase class I/II-fold pyridoxal phosphate-dependent enzyme [Chloroflexota bacterium]